MDNTVNSSGTFTAAGSNDNKFEISHLNLHYGAFPPRVFIIRIMRIYVK